MWDGSSRRRAVAIGLLIVILLGSMFATAQPRETLSPVERVARDVWAPVETTLSVAIHYVRERVGRWRTIRSLREENDQLRRELASLRVRNQFLEEAWRENQALRSVLGFMREREMQSVPAVVIGRPVSNWWSQMTINRGRRHGVSPRRAVVSGEGAVGWVLSVTERTAEVMLLVDPRSAVGAVVRRTSDPVVVEGALTGPARLRLRALVADADLAVGDLVVTSGFSHLFPAGLPVGRIVAVSPTATGRAAEAWVEPAVDFSRLEVVAVLVDEGADLEDGSAGGRDSSFSEGATPEAESAASETEAASPVGGRRP